MTNIDVLSLIDRRGSIWGMRKLRFRAENLSGDVIAVQGSEAVHGIRVLRLAVGDPVELFDGAGSAAQGHVCSVDHESFKVRVSSIVQTPAAVTEIVLGVAPPKGARADWLVEKCGELGISALWPMQTGRGLVQPGAGKLERWRRIASEAAKQSVQPRIMRVEAGRSLPEVLDAASRSDGGAFAIYYGRPETSVPALRAVLDQDVAKKIQKSILMLIGPEGGFTPEEHDMIEKKTGRPVRLADNILRVETAAVAAAAIIAEWRLSRTES